MDENKHVTAKMPFDDLLRILDLAMHHADAVPHVAVPNSIFKIIAVSPTTTAIFLIYFVLN